MTKLSTTPSAIEAGAFAATFAVCALTPASLNAGGDKVAFPDSYAGGVMYSTVERTDIKQVREFYTSQAAIDAAKKGEPMPDGTVITMVQFAALLEAGGNPQKGPNGGYVKGKRLGYAVMEKRAGWGEEYPPEQRNGEWEYQAFGVDKTVNDKANLAACFQCHKPLEKQDFVFSVDKMKAAK